MCLKKIGRVNPKYALANIGSSISLNLLIILFQFRPSQRPKCWYRRIWIDLQTEFSSATFICWNKFMRSRNETCYKCSTKRVIFLKNDFLRKFLYYLVNKLTLFFFAFCRYRKKYSSAAKSIKLYCQEMNEMERALQIKPVRVR